MKTGRIMRKLLFAVLLGCTLVPGAWAQDYKYEIGVEGGVGTYLGDANRSLLFRRVGFAGGAAFRYVINYRWAVKTTLSAVNLAGDTRDFDYHLPEGKHYSFNHWLYNAGAQIEFNFFNYGMGYSYLETSRIAPYLLAGLGICYSPAGGAQFVSASIPLGVGVKFKLAPRWNLAVEFTMRKTLGDSLDGKALDDAMGISSSFWKNTDWFSTSFFTITYDFGAKKKVCNNL